jgi:citrate synthase
MATLPRLTAAQAAARLGVKPQTLYAYVSRGLLSRERDARGSSFDPIEIEEFASARRPSTSRTTRPGPSGSPGSPLMVLDTDIALIEDDELFLRGMPAAELALEHSYESVARWLWGEPLTAGGGASAPGAAGAADDPGFVADPAGTLAAREAVDAIGTGATALDRIQVAVPALAVADPTRHDLDPVAVRSAAGRLIAGVVAAVPGCDPAREAFVSTSNSAERKAGHARASTPKPQESIADALWRALAGRAAVADERRALNAALVLLVDHDLAVSTLAARAAASARATPYAVVSSGLGALDSALHGNASAAASELIGLVLDGTDARTAIAQTVARSGRPAPGFGQPLYSGIDARAAVLLPLVAELPDGAPVVDAVDRLAAEVAAHTGRRPYVDLALAALTTAARMPADAGAAVFAVGRMAGWIAHALDEYEQRPLRLRPRGRYVGPPAGTPAALAAHRAP